MNYPKNPITGGVFKGHEKTIPIFTYNIYYTPPDKVPKVNECIFGTFCSSILPNSLDKTWKFLYYIRIFTKTPEPRSPIPDFKNP